MLDQINNDIKSAMKAKEKGRLEAIRMLKSAFLENNTSKNPIADADVAINYVKKLKDSLASYPEGSAEAQKILDEIEYLSPYVPKSMDEAEVEALVDAFLKENADANFGMVMKHLSPQIKGRFDGKAATLLVKGKLEKSS